MGYNSLGLGSTKPRLGRALCSHATPERVEQHGETACRSGQVSYGRCSRR